MRQRQDVGFGPVADHDIYILNGPNLNMLGLREPEIYGSDTLADIEAMCRDRAGDHGLDVIFRQSNIEGEIVSWIQEARESADGIVINPAAYTHTSVAIRDALILSDLPIIEVHLSNIHKRETWRHHSYVSDIAKGVIMGLGAQGYLLAIDALARLMEQDG